MPDDCISFSFSATLGSETPANNAALSTDVRLLLDSLLLLLELYRELDVSPDELSLPKSAFISISLVDICICVESGKF